MDYQPSFDDLPEEYKGNSKKVSQVSGYEPSFDDLPKESLLEKAGNLAGSFNAGVEKSRLPALAGGLLQGTGDIGASLGNLLLKPINKEMGTDLNIPHPNLGKYAGNDIASKAAFGAGELGSAFVPGVGWGKAAGKIGELGGLTEKVSKIPFIGKMLAPGIGGAAAGYALGENKEGNRGVGTAVGATLGPVSAAASKLEVPQMLTSLFNKITPKGLASIIQKGYDTASAESSKIFNNVESEAVKRGVNKVTIDNKLIDKADKYLPKTLANKDLINAARTGDYKAVRDLQSDLWKRATKAENSEMTADQNKGELLHDLRDEINDSIAKHFEQSGHKDLADSLKDAMSKWRSMKELYTPKEGSAAIKKLVNPNLRKVPNNIIDVLEEDSKPMKAIRSAHPEIGPLIKVLKNKKSATQALKALAGIGLAGTAGGLGATYGPSIMSKLLGRSE